jgi:hypothetical protein
MNTLSRALVRWDPMRVSGVFLGLAILSLVGAYGYAAYNVQPTIGSIGAAVALVGIAGSGLLYAWRVGAGGIAD